MKKNVASQKVGAGMVSATDGSAFTGAVTVYVTGDAGTQAAGSVGSGACTHEGNGYHTYAPAQAETNYDLIAFTFTGTGAVPATVQIYTSYPQTGDSYAEVTSGTYGLAVIEAQTDDIGAAGAGLTAVPWNAAWDAEVQSEVDDALVAQNLDHLVKIAVDTDFATTVHLDSVIGQIADSGTTATFDRTTDSLEALQGAVDTIDNFLDTEVAAIKAKTDQLTFTTANQVDATTVTIATGAVSAAALAADAGNEIADAVLDRNMATGTDSGSTTVRTPRQAMRLLRNKTAIAAGTMTVNKEDDATASWTAAITTTAGDPVSAIDPAGP